MNMKEISHDACQQQQDERILRRGHQLRGGGRRGEFGQRGGETTVIDVYTFPYSLYCFLLSCERNSGFWTLKSNNAREDQESLLLM